MTWVLVAGAVGLLGLLAVSIGVALSIASKVFHVEVDPRVAQLESLLPGANCGACGLAGCAAMAEQIVAGHASPTRCPVCSQVVRTRIFELLGRAVEVREPMIARLLCGGGTRCVNKADYDGVGDCRAAVLVHGGPKACDYSCVGLASCVDACPFEAIFMADDGLPRVIEERCTSCGACERICPRSVIKVMPLAHVVWVKCSSHDPGRVVNKLCKSGCIACRLCQKACPVDAIHVVDNLAVIDYAKCTFCGECVKVCPKHVIVDVRTARAARAAETAASHR